MTVSKIFKSALSLCGESNTAPYLAAFAVDWANALMAELFETEQSIRRAEGKDEMKALPVLASLEDEVPYSDALVGGAFIFGFASLICDLCDDRELAAGFRARGAKAANSAAKANEAFVLDVYSPEVSI